MATKVWIGAAARVARVATVTPANVNIGNSFLVTFPGGRVFTFVATAATVANAVLGLYALLTAAGQDPLVQALRFTIDDPVTPTKLTITGQPGISFTNTSSASGGTATNVTAVVTAGTGPNYWDNVNNWDTGSIPANGDTAIFDNSNVSCLYNISDTFTGLTAGVGLAELRVGRGFTGQIGLPQQDPAGYPNVGYRPTYLEVAAVLINIGAGSGSGSGRIKLDNKTQATTMTVYATGQPLDSEAVLFKGTGANVVNILGGSLGVAALPGESSTLTTFRSTAASANQPPSYRIGAGTTLTTLTHVDGTGIVQCAITTVTKSGGTLTLTGTGAVTTLTNEAGTVIDQSSGTITTLTNGNGGVYRFDSDTRPKTVTNANFYGGCEVNDHGSRVTWTNRPALVHCTLAQIKLDLGYGVGV
jgi:hypothetical protein